MGYTFALCGYLRDIVLTILRRSSTSRLHYLNESLIQHIGSYLGDITGPEEHTRCWIEKEIARKTRPIHKGTSTGVLGGG